MITWREVATMQLLLHASEVDLGSGERFCETALGTYTRSHTFYPSSCLSYEQMFPLSRTSTLAQRTLGALRLTRSFLLLEDDYDVDWEVDWNEPSGEVAHPHRAPLRGGLARRRPGEPATAQQLCLSPITSPAGMMRGRTHRAFPGFASVWRNG
jgi:hypothetical protein